MYMQMGGWCLTTGGAKVLVYTVGKFNSTSNTLFHVKHIIPPIALVLSHSI